jgi:transposase
MRDRDLYAKLLGIETPWFVRDVDTKLEAGKIEILIGFSEKAKTTCPECGVKCGRYDTRSRSWRHLDTMQYQTVLTADVPRVKCPEHGVKQVKVPWAEPGSRLTAMFERLVIDWMQAVANIKAVAAMLRMTWDEVDGVVGRAVRRGLERRESKPLRQIGLDETSFQKRHEYVTVVYDVERKHVIEVLDGRTRQEVEKFYWETPYEHLETIESISMDMWPAYINATLEHIPDAENKIAFDRFHVAKYFGDGVNKVRREEAAELNAIGDDILKGTRLLWQQNPENMKPANLVRFQHLRNSSLKVAKAWAMKETARGLWLYSTRGWAMRGWTKLLDWMSRSRLKPMVKVGQTIRNHLWGIINAVILKANNAHLEAVNTKIQALKKNACGYRNRVRFRHAILFHCGGLDLYPQLAAAHTNS